MGHPSAKTQSLFELPLFQNSPKSALRSSFPAPDTEDDFWHKGMIPPFVELWCGFER